MKPLIAFLFILMCWCCPGYLLAQGIQFRKLTSNQGLSHNTVYAISQDDKGQMWFATREGLNRYDSYQIKNYYIQDSLQGVSPDKINTLLCNKDMIYLATEDGLFIYRQKTEHILRSEAFSRRVNILGLLKAAGAVYVCTTAGLYKISGHKSTLISPENIPVRAMGQLSDNRFLISTGNKLQIIGAGGRVLRSFDSSVLPVLGISGFDVFNIYKDTQGVLWLCTNHGLFYFDAETQRFYKLRFAQAETKEDNTVRAITGSGKDELYIGTEHGLYVYHLSTGISEHYGQSFTGDPKKLNDKAVYSAFMAKDGSIWLGTYFGGINYIPSNTYAFERIMPGDNGKGLLGKAVSQMMEDNKRRIWIGTEDGGITIYNPVQGSYSYINKDTRPFHLNINNVHAIHDDGYGNVWVGTFLGGLHKFDFKKQQTVIYTNRPGDSTSLSNDNVYAVYRDSRGTLWIGTQNGVNIYDYQKGNFSHFRPEVFRGQFIYDITEDHSGHIWFCTRFDGIYRYNPSSGTIYHYSAGGHHAVLTSNQIISLYKDSKQHIWFGTLGGGVSIYDITKDSFRSFTTADGLPDNNVYGIIEDGAGFVWLSTNRGLSKYDPGTNRFVNYNNKYGLPSNQFNFKSYLKAGDGTLYFGSINGLSFFHPEHIASRHPLVPLIFTDFQLFNKSVTPSTDGVLQNQIDYASAITLSYRQNVFTINYAAIDYANPGSTQYAYYLKGFEDKWNYVGGKNSVTYTNLSPGNYTFYVVAVRADGAQQSVERTLRIKVSPPFYQTRLAYVVYVLLILVLVWLYTRFIKFLHQKKTEVQIERIEKEKTKELTQNRLNFFTFISHEFKTPLTLILASIEKFIEEKGPAFKKNTELVNIKNSASVLFKLIQQLMEFRKMETGHNSVELTHADIIAFLKETTAYFETIAKSNNTRLSFNTEVAGLPCYFDKDKIEKIVFNLLSNAIKNTRGGEVTLRVTEEIPLPDSGNPVITVKIADTGMGMSADALENIFNPFYKAEDSKEGSGIGLALVGSLVGYLDGHITIDSAPGKGTVAVVTLPVLLKANAGLPKRKIWAPDPPHNTTVPAVSAPQSKPATAGEGQKRYTLLIVEDNKELQVFLSSHFAPHYNTSTAANGLAALKKIEKTPPDIIISDVNMPKMDGLELCRRVKNDPQLSYIPVILLSEWESQDIRVDGLNIGADAYLGKPFNLKELELLVANMIQSRVKLREHVVSISELAIDNLPSNNKNQEFLAKLTGTLEKRFADSDVTIELLARDLNMSRTSLHLNLKKTLNKSASELLNEYRLRRAAIMLENDMPVGEVAYACGYKDPNYFSRVFKKHYAVTPARYREQAKNASEGS